MRVCSVSYLISDLPLRSRRYTIHRPGMDPASILLNTHSARNSRRTYRTAGTHYTILCPARALPESSPHRAMDLATLDLCLGDRRHRVPDAVPALHSQPSSDSLAQAFALGRLDTASCQRARFFWLGWMRMLVGRPKSTPTIAVISAIV